MSVTLSAFMTGLEEIAAASPSYRKGGSGKDGTCDCIGLIIGALRRAGENWSGLHGSNYAARSEIHSLAPIQRRSDLKIGELVFKAYSPGASGYNLPKRYMEGGGSANGDLWDYYHVGVVMSSNPLRILHMSTKGIQTDSKLGQWEFHGWCKRISENEREGVKSMSEKDLQASYPTEIVTIESANGLAVKLRAQPNASCSLYWEIPSGSAAILLSHGEAWCEVRAADAAGKEHIGWMKSEFVKEGSSAVPIPDEILSQLHAAQTEMDKQMDLIWNLLGGRG